jgi:drug/metabolite transporter (DMT)-like permease
LPLDLALFYQSLPVALILMVPAVFHEGMYAQWEPEFIGAMAWLIVAVSLCAYALMFRLLARIDATRVASLFYLGPPVTMLMAWVAFDDALMLMDMVGLLVVCSGVLLAQIPARDKYATKP